MAIALIGAGGHARVVAEALQLTRQPVAGYIAPTPGQTPRLLGVYLGDDNGLAELGLVFDLALGLGFVDATGARRRAELLRLLSILAAPLVTVVHPMAIVSPSAELGTGSFVAMGAMVGTGACIGRGAIVNTGAVIDHESSLGENVHLATGARLAGGVDVGRDVLIGAGAVVRQGLSIGDGAVIGAGAVVIRPVAAGQTVVGNPARARP